MSNCRQCGAALPAVSFGDISDYCADCKKLAPPSKHNLIDYLPQIASTHAILNATNVLFALNCMVFIAMTAKGASPILPDTEDLLRWGADYGPLTLGGQPWRLITNAFLHIGIIHLALNMWVFWRLGRMLEKLIGSVMLAGVYLLTGIGASLLSLSWNPMRVSAGASGAIFGIIGVLISLLFYAKLDIPQDRMSKLRAYATRLALLNLFYGLARHIDNMAHLGGLVTGLVIGFFFARSIALQSHEVFREVRILIVSACALAVVFVPVARAKSYMIDLDLGKAAIRNKEYKAAIPHLERYTRAQKDDASAHLLLGYALHNAGHTDEAVHEYEQSLQLEPDQPAVSVTLAELYMAQGKAKEAVPLFRDNIVGAKGRSTEYLIYGEALAATGDYRQAEWAFTKSISLNSKIAEAHLERAKALRALHRDSEAKKEDEQAAALMK